MIKLKSPAQIEGIAAAGAIVAEVLEMAAGAAVPGRTTAELDETAEAAIRERPGAVPAFKGLYGFPATLCTSINEEVVHGIPSSKRSLRAGDILSVDVGVKYDGLYADAAVTVPVGEVTPAAEHLLGATRDALDAGVGAAQAGARLGDLGWAIQSRVEAAGYSVIRELVGHGVGEAPHEEPQVPNHGVAGRGLRLQPGLVIAIEPMVNQGRREIRTLEDDWTVVTADGQLSAHFEHTVAVTEAGPRILTRVASPATARES